MLHLEASITIRAPKERVADLYTDYENWPRVFPTIKGVRLIGRDGSKQVLEVDHLEGKVVNELVVRPPDDVDLWEVKHRYDALFVNRFETVPGGTRMTVRGDIRLKGWAKLLQPFLAGHARRQIRRFQLQPVKAAAERGRSSSIAGVKRTRARVQIPPPSIPPLGDAPTQPRP